MRYKVTPIISMKVMVSCKTFLNTSTIKEQILKYENDIMNYSKDEFDFISVDVYYA